MDFAGKVCPYCKTAFTENDDVVVCSACEMPHHKECWVENQGCTTFGCMGAIKSADVGFGALPAVLAAKYCMECGAPSVLDARFCAGCGTLFAPATPVAMGYASAPGSAPAAQSVNYYLNGTRMGYTTSAEQADLENFLYVNVHYYTEKFYPIRQQGRKASWNWVAFFFPVYWSFYRKIYGIGFLSLLIINIASVLPTIPRWLIFFGWELTMGIMGNYFYSNYVQRKMEKANYLSEEQKREYYRKKGKTSPLAVILTIVVMIVLSIVVTANQSGYFN